MIRLIEHIDELQTIKEACNALADNLERPFLRYEWLNFSARAFYRPHQLKIVVLETRNEVSAVAPLVVAEHNWNGGLELLGTGILPVPSGFLFRDEAALEDLTAAVLKMPLPLHLRGIESGSSEARIFDSSLADSTLAHFQRRVAIPWMPISGSWANYLRQLSSEKKSCLKTFDQFARSIGEIGIEIDSPSANRAGILLGELQQCERLDSWNQVPASIFLHDRVVPHFSEFVKTLAKSGMLRTSVLRLNGDTGAVHLGLEYAQRLWSLAMFLDRKWYAWSPDALLIHEVIHYAFESRLYSLEVVDGDRSRLQLSTGLTRKLGDYQICQTQGQAVFALVKEAAQFPTHMFMHGPSHVSTGKDLESRLSAGGS